jgi:hypothetical protein
MFHKYIKFSFFFIYLYKIYKMLKIMIVSFYDLIEYFAAIKKGFIKYGYNVVNYPLFRYAYDQYDKKKDYAKHFIEYINEQQPNILLWCFIDVPSDIFVEIKNKFPNIIFILFNFDEPMNISTELFKKADTCEIIVTTSKEYHNEYKKHTNAKHIIYNPFGCDIEFFYPLDLDEREKYSEFNCDITMVCYNLLYDTNYFNSQFINRKEMLDNISAYCKKNKKIFKLYGSPVLNEFYPENYSGDISYLNKNKLFNNSKIVICTQSFNNKSYYFDENIFSILASGALLLTDKSKDIENIFTNKQDLIFLDKYYYIKQIDGILLNYNKYEHIRKNSIDLAKKYSWDIWCQNVHTIIVKLLFNPLIYSDIYNLDITEATYDNWLKNGLKNNHIAINLKIPNNFNSIAYSKKYNLDNRTREFLFYHWFHFDKSDLFFGNEQSNTSFDPTKYNISMEKFMLLSTFFDEIKYDCQNSLYKINNISKNHPNSNINKLLEIYLQLTE